MRFTRSRRLAFTLVEVLVVIGIIGILIAILLPTIRGARRQARLVQCSSNLRNLIQASLMHAQEHGGFLPLAGYIACDPVNSLSDLPTSLNDSSRKRYTYATWPVVPGSLNPAPLPAALGPYLGVKDLPFDNWDKLDQVLNDRNQDGVWRRFMCPDTNAMEKGRYSTDPNDANAVDQGTMLVTAVANEPFTAWSTNSDYGFNEGVFGYHYDQRYAHNRVGGNIARVRRSSEVAVYTDAIARPGPAVSFMPIGWICWTPSLDGQGAATLGDAFAGTGRAVGRENFDLNRHSKRMNIAFLDGHVETVEIKQEALDRVFLIMP